MEVKLGGYNEPDAGQRKSSAKKAKEAMQEKFKAATQDPSLKDRQAARAAVVEARTARQAEREQQWLTQQLHAKKMAEREAEQAAEAARAEQEAAAHQAAEAAEKETALLAEQKAARDARYAVRKVAKKQRRKGDR